MLRTLSLTLAAASSLITIGAAEPKRPNVILMMADDLGYGDISCYGSKLNRTPVLDRLANEGVRLTDYHSGSTVCTPSRMALLSGYYPLRVGWPGGVLGFKMHAKGGLSEEVRTIAEVYKDAGYRTALVGKWHLGDHPDRLPMGQGFDEAYFIKMSNNQTKSLWRGSELVMNPFDNRRLSENFTAESIDFIRRNHEHPFFLYLPFTAPHFPVEAHPDWDGKSNNKAFGDVVEELDARIGDIMKVLVELGIDDNTLVVFTSDNGPQPSKKNKTTADPLRGHKWSSLEGGTRVPCIIRWPGKLQPGSTYSGLMASIDMLPTLASACGIRWQALDQAPPLDGIPLWNELSNTVTSGKGREELLLWDGWAHLHAVRRGPWKLFVDENEWVEQSATHPVLFNLDQDIRETTNVADQHPEIVKELTERARKGLLSIKEQSIPLGGGLDQPAAPHTSRWLK